MNPSAPGFCGVAFLLASVVLVSLLATADAAEEGGGGDPLKVLIITGRNNHNWRETTPVVKDILRASGRFSVDVSLKPESLRAEDFAKYDVVLSNWSNWPKTKNRDWGEDCEKAFLDFIRSGKGFVVFHAAAATFHGWPEFQQLIGSTWKLGQTGHGRVHEFTVDIADKDHPVTRGMKAFKATDELWHRVGVHDKLNVLCTAHSARKMGGSGNDEPAAHWRTFGKGRVFHLILGHDGRALRSPGTSALLARGTEWAATGEVTLPLPEALSAEEQTPKP